MSDLTLTTRRVTGMPILKSCSMTSGALRVPVKRRVLVMPPCGGGSLRQRHATAPSGGVPTGESGGTSREMPSATTVIGSRSAEHKYRGFAHRVNVPADSRINTSGRLSRHHMRDGVVVRDFRSVVSPSAEKITDQMFKHAPALGPVELFGCAPGCFGMVRVMLVVLKACVTASTHALRLSTMLPNWRRG